MAEPLRPRTPTLKYLGISALIVVIALTSWSFMDTDKYDLSRREILMRRIGHELLLQSGDSTSRVLPIQKSGNSEYRIRFEKDLSFQPDSLVALTRRVLAQDPLAEDYTVNVMHCQALDVAYAFLISGTTKDDLVACSGRIQPRSCYTLSIVFKPQGLKPIEKGYLLGSLPLLSLLGLLYYKTHKNDPVTSTLTVGQTHFFLTEKKLEILGKQIELTGTETRLLRIFAASPNRLIPRARLQKEIWEDEGVIVGRSLDVFISKLRKKLESDSTLAIEVLRGKGYTLVEEANRGARRSV